MYPHGDSNPSSMAENHVSWTRLDDRGVCTEDFNKQYVKSQKKTAQARIIDLLEILWYNTRSTLHCTTVSSFCRAPRLRKRAASEYGRSITIKTLKSVFHFTCRRRLACPAFQKDF